MEKNDVMEEKAENFEKYFKKPTIIAIIADRDEGKSNLAYNMIEVLTKNNNINNSYLWIQKES